MTILNLQVTNDNDDVRQYNARFVLLDADVVRGPFDDQRQQPLERRRPHRSRRIGQHRGGDAVGQGRPRQL